VAVARDALMLWELPEGSLLKRCDDDTCRRVFLDRSRGNRRRWCGMANCGDRSKARAYRSRRRAAVSLTELKEEES
jgi:predicted RNA-binding Zn ribbon-like protein